MVVNSKFISSDGKVQKFSDKNFQPAKAGDILMVMSDLPNGKALAKTFMVPQADKYAVNQRVCILRAKRGVPAYFRYQLNRNVYFLGFDDGVQQTHLLNRIFLECPVVVPETIEEQRAIAQALSDTDDLIVSLDALIAKKRDIKQGAMQQLLSGKRRLPGLSGEWKGKRVGDLAACMRGVTYKGDGDLRESANSHTRMLLRSNNIYEGKLTFQDVQHVVCERVKDSQLLQAGDILLCMANGSKALVGKSALVDADYPNLTFGAFMGCLRPHNRQDGAFLHSLFQTQAYRMQIADALSGSSINNLSPKQIEGLSFLLPDAAERVEIANYLQAFERDEGAHREQRAKVIAIRQGMMQQLLTGSIRLI